MAEAGSGPGTNIAILGHSHDGKTTLAEALLFAAGAVPRMGSTDQGTALLDYEPEEQRRHISVQLGIAGLTWKGAQLGLLDTPGFQDFEGEVRQALGAADAALVVVAAPSGANLPLGAETAWELLTEPALPRIVVITKMDKENADFEATLAGLRRWVSPKPVAMQIPIGAESSFKGVVDLVSMRAHLFDAKGGHSEGKIPEELAEAAAKRRQEMVEAVAETDDALLERYLDGKEPDTEELESALRQAAAAGRLAPVLLTAPALGLGASRVLDAISSWLAQPRPEPGSELPTLQVFKTVADPFGKISYFRVLRGTLRADAHLSNLRSGQEERIAKPLRPRGKSLDPVDRLQTGELGAATKLLHVATGDTLGPKGASPAPGLTFPPASYTMALTPKAKGDEERIQMGLNHILEEDPTLQVERDPATHETLLHGLGDVHLDVTLEKLRRKYQVEAVLALPQVPYQEAIRGSARQQHKYKKQSGGAGLYGDCTIEIEPLPRGSGFVWEDKIFGGAIPQQFRLSVEKGVRQTLEQGVLAGFPLVDLKVRLVDGSTHPVDGKDIAFQLAGAMAMREAVGRSEPFLLEPVMEVEVVVPAAHMGEVIGQLNTRRAHIGGMTPLPGETEQVAAQVPLAEMYRFPIELRAMTQGRGRYRMSFSHYQEVPPQVAQPIIEARRQQHGREAGAG